MRTSSMRLENPAVAAGREIRFQNITGAFEARQKAFPDSGFTPPRLRWGGARLQPGLRRAAHGLKQQRRIEIALAAGPGVAQQGLRGEPLGVELENPGRP